MGNEVSTSTIPHAEEMKARVNVDALKHAAAEAANITELKRQLDECAQKMRDSRKALEKARDRLKIAEQRR